MLSGLKMTGTSTTSQIGHDAADLDCPWQMETSAPINNSVQRRPVAHD